MTVLVAGRHHGQMPVNGPDAVVCQEVLFDKAQGVIRSIVQSTLTKGTKKKIERLYCIMTHLKT